MRKTNDKQEPPSTIEAQELIYERRLKQMEKTKGLSRGDLIKRATKLSVGRERRPVRHKTSGV